MNTNFADTVILCIEIIGTIAFALSGAVIAAQRRMDIFGVLVLGVCTAVGGGIYGDYVRKHLTERGVPIHVSRPERENGCCYCMVEDGGERTFIVDHGVEYTFSEDYLENIDTETIDSVYVCGLEVEEVNGPEIMAYLEKHPDYTVYFAPGARVMKIQPERMVGCSASTPFFT